MSEKFLLEIISPDNSILKSEIEEAIIPAYEGQIGILKDHIPLITFLRPGIIDIKEDKKETKFYVEDGVVEFSDNKLLILSSTVEDLKLLDQQKINFMIESSKKELKNEAINDKLKYFLSYKINTLNEIKN